MDKSARQTLEVELKTFENLLPRLLRRYSGYHAVISGDQLLGVRKDWKKGLALGYKKVGLKPFLVREITKDQKVHFLPSVIT